MEENRDEKRFSSWVNRDGTSPLNTRKVVLALRDFHSSLLFSLKDFAIYEFNLVESAWKIIFSFRSLAAVCHIYDEYFMIFVLKRFRGEWWSLHYNE